MKSYTKSELIEAYEKSVITGCPFWHFNSRMSAWISWTTPPCHTKECELDGCVNFGRQCPVSGDHFIVNPEHGKPTLLEHLRLLVTQ